MEDKEKDGNAENGEAGETVETVETVETEAAKPEEDLWRRYMDLFVKKEEHLQAKDRFHLRKAADLPDLPNVESEDEFPVAGYPINIFNQTDKPTLPNRLKPEENVQVWNRMRANPPVDMTCFIPDQGPSISKTDSGRWPGVFPCMESNSRSYLSKKKRKFGEPCTELDLEDAELREPKDDFADHIELWHARIPVTCPTLKSNPPMVDRACGINHSLVSGDYILTETVSKKNGNRVYANICLRGLVGMHLPELDALRARNKTWKWCFYQAIVALLVKTQLRYKHTWSGNIDYIYERGWNLFQHIGNINVKHVGKQKFDDVCVYNYAYNVEVELIQEMKDVPRITNVAYDYVEINHRRTMEVERKDFVKLESKIGVEKKNDRQTAPVHKATKEIEKWFDKLPFQYQNCIFRTTRYSLAFWKEGPFWYLYNPYRCDDFGFWDDAGYACIVKFCSRNALKRHLMILLLRAYVYEVPKPQLKNDEKIVDENAVSEENNEEKIKDVFTVQIFQLIYNKCELRNSKLLERRMPKPMTRPVVDKDIEICPHDPLDPVDICDDESEEINNIENPGWLKRFKITWTRSEASSKKIVKGNIVTGKLRWHQFYVEEPYKLFSLWGEIHPTQALFPVQHRGKQIYACYVVCAGMTRITAPEYWTPKTLDAIVLCGEKYYTTSTMEAELKASRPEYSAIKNWDRYLARNFKIGETVFRGELLPGIKGRLYVKANSLSETIQNMFLKHYFGIVTCESTCVCVFKFCGSYYMCDVRSTGPPLFQYGGGVAYLIRSTCFLKFITVLTLTIASTECSEFQVYPIQIGNAVDVGRTPCLTRNERTDRPRKHHKRPTKVSCPYETDERISLLKNCRPKTAKQKRTFGKDSCKGEGSPCEAAGMVKLSTT